MHKVYRGTSLIRTPTPLGSPQVPRHRAAVGSYGGGVSYERGTPVGRASRLERGHLLPSEERTT